MSLLWLAFLLPTFVVANEGDVYITAATLAAQHNAKVIDVRETTDFEARHLPGSLHVPLHAVKTKRFLRNAEVVIVDGGWGSRRTRLALEDLAGRGFRSVRVLKGGVATWEATGGEVAGVGRLSRQPGEITAAEFIEASASGGWLIIDSRGRAEQELPEALQGAVPLPYPSLEKDAFTQTLVATYRSRSAGERLLILDEDGSRYETLRDVRHTLAPEPVYYLKGGLQAFKEFQGAQIAMEHAYSKTSVSRAGDPRPHASKGCSSCP